MGKLSEYVAGSEELPEAFGGDPPGATAPANPDKAPVPDHSVHRSARKTQEPGYLIGAKKLFRRQDLKGPHQAFPLPMIRGFGACHQRVSRRPGALPRTSGRPWTLNG